MRKAFFAVLATTAAGAALADIQPGNWEMTVTTSVEGMPGGMQPVTQTHCITEQDARDPSRLVGQAGCEFTDKRDTGSALSFNIVCRGQVPMSGSGVVRYTATTVDATIDITATANDQRIVTRSQLSGRRLGGC